jgi:hypothetical protein
MISQKCVSSTTTCICTLAATARTVEEMQWEVLPHPAYSTDLAPSDFHLFGPLKEALVGTDLELTKYFLCNDGWTSNHKPFSKGP